MTLTSYLDTALMRDNLHISETTYPKKVSEIVTQANQALDAALKGVLPEQPLDKGSEQYGQIRKCAVHFARKLWFSFIVEYSMAKEEKVQYDEMLATITQSFMADRNKRTISVVAALDPRRSKVLMPSHRDTFIDIFG